MAYETHQTDCDAVARVAQLVKLGYRAYAIGAEVRFWVG